MPILTTALQIFETNALSLAFESVLPSQHELIFSGSTPFLVLKSTPFSELSARPVRPPRTRFLRDEPLPHTTLVFSTAVHKPLFATSKTSSLVAHAHAIPLKSMLISSLIRVTKFFATSLVIDVVSATKNIFDTLRTSRTFFPNNEPPIRISSRASLPSTF